MYVPALTWIVEPEVVTELHALYRDAQGFIVVPVPDVSLPDGDI
jgi:hypothetical protein